MALRNLKQKYPDIVYICIGDGDELENIKELVKELDLNAQVMFFNDISDELKNSLNKIFSNFTLWFYNLYPKLYKKNRKLNQYSIIKVRLSYI